VVPLEKTGTVLEPPPATVVLNVVIEESDTNVLAPTPAIAASGNVLTVYIVDDVLAMETKEVNEFVN
jgi:hypothetical protein